MNRRSKRIEYMQIGAACLVTALVSGIARADCQLPNGTSRAGAVVPAELLPPCAKQANGTLDDPTIPLNQSSRRVLAKKPESPTNLPTGSTHY